MISLEKMLIAAEVNRCVTLFIYFLDLLQIKYDCQVSSLFHMCDKLQGRGPPPILEEPKNVLPPWDNPTNRFDRPDPRKINIPKHIFDDCVAKFSSSQITSIKLRKLIEIDKQAIFFPFLFYRHLNIQQTLTFFSTLEANYISCKLHSYKYMFSYENNINFIVFLEVIFAVLGTNS